MKLLGRSTAALLLAGMLGWGVASSAKESSGHRPRPAARIEQSIAIAVNGELLPTEPAPRVVGKGGGRLVVPVVKIFAALGIGVSRTGGTITASAPNETIVLHLGSATATIDGRPVPMEAPAQEIDNTTYVPLRFVADALGAQVSFDPRAERVEVVSSLIGRTPNLVQPGVGGGSQVIGEATAVDLDSVPATITVARGISIRTLPVPASASVELQDVVARTSSSGGLADVRPGDAVSVALDRDGRVDAVIVRYASRVGTIAATSANAFVLNTGFIVEPTRTTTVTLNAQSAQLSDLAVGDAVVVRLNPDTDEERQIIASRAQASATVSPGPVRISSFTVTPADAELRAGGGFDVLVQGTPGASATYDIGTFVSGLPLAESPPGTYRAHYTVPANVNFPRTNLIARLTVGGVSARGVSTATVAVSNTPPQVVDVAPSGDQPINNSRPSIYATYRAPTGIGIDAASVHLRVNGLDVTDETTRTADFITYSPELSLPDGTERVEVRVSDLAGNVATRAWTFNVRVR